METSTFSRIAWRILEIVGFVFASIFVDDNRSWGCVRAVRFSASFTAFPRRVILRAISNTFQSLRFDFDAFGYLWLFFGNARSLESAMTFCETFVPWLLERLRPVVPRQLWPGFRSSSARAGPGQAVMEWTERDAAKPNRTQSDRSGADGAGSSLIEPDRSGPC